MNKKINCDFCRAIIKDSESNSGSNIASLIGKKKLRICNMCNSLEIILRINQLLNKKEDKKAFVYWLSNQDEITQHYCKKYSKYFKNGE